MIQTMGGLIGKKRLASAGLLLLAGISTGAEAAKAKSGGGGEVAALREQIKALQQTVKVLAEKVDKAQTTATNAETQVTAIAPTGSPVATQEDVTGIQSDVENFKWQWQRERDYHTALTTRNTTIFGTVQAKYGWNQLPRNTNFTTNSSDNSFDIGTALIGFRGLLYRDYEEGRNLEYQVSFGASPQTGTPSANVLDAFVRYNVLPTINLEEPRLNLTMGQQLIPYGIEPTATEDLKPLINNAMWTREPTGKEFGVTTNKFLGLGLRQIGFIVRGDLFPQVDWGSNYRAPIVDYAVGVINGNGPNTSDDNSEKDWVGRLGFTAPVDYNSWIRELKFGGSFYVGTQNRTWTPTVDIRGKPIPVATQTVAWAPTGQKNRFGFDVSWNHNPFGVTYEYVRGWDGDVIPGTAKTNPNLYTRLSEGQTATLFYNFGEQFVKSYRDKAKYDDWWPQSYQPFIRWDYFNQNVNVKGLDYYILTPGFNAFFAETTKLQLNYNIKFRNGTHQKQDEFLLQLQYGF